MARKKHLTKSNEK